MSQCSKGCFSVCSKIQVLFCIYYIYKGSVLLGVLLLFSASYELLWISYIRVYSFSLIHMQIPPPTSWHWSKSNLQCLMVTKNWETLQAVTRFQLPLTGHMTSDMTSYMLCDITSDMTSKITYEITHDRASDITFNRTFVDFFCVCVQWHKI